MHSGTVNGFVMTYTDIPAGSYTMFIYVNNKGFMKYKKDIATDQITI